LDTKWAVSFKPASYLLIWTLFVLKIDKKNVALVRQGFQVFSGSLMAAEMNGKWRMEKD